MAHETVSEDLNSRLERLQPGDHVCLLHQSQDRWREFVSAFVRGGMLSAERVIMLCSDYSAYQVMQVLQAAGLEPARRIFEGQLVLVKQGDADSRKFFDPDRVLAFLRLETSRARFDGFRGLRVTADLTSVLRSTGSEDAVVSYEARLADFFATHSAIVACQYDRNFFSEEFLLSILDLHPIVVSDGSVLENRIFYSSFHESAGPAAAAYKLAERLRTLREWNYAERKTGEGLAWIQKLAAVAPIGVFLMDQVGNCVYVNDQWCRIADVSPEDALGTGWAAALHPEDANIAVTQWTKAVAAGADFEGEFRMRPNSRRLRSDAQWVSIRARTLRGPRNEITGYIGILQDRTHEVLREMELRDSKRWLSSIFRALPAAVSVREVESGKYLDVNDAFERFAGLSRAEILGRTPFELGFYEGCLEENRESLLKVNSGSAIPMEFHRPSGGRILATVSKSLIGSPRGPCVLSLIHPRAAQG